MSQSRRDQVTVDDLAQQKLTRGIIKAAAQIEVRETFFVRVEARVPTRWAKKSTTLLISGGVGLLWLADWLIPHVRAP